MSVAGYDPPKPIKTFQQCGFDASLMAAIAKAGWVWLLACLRHPSACKVA